MEHSATYINVHNVDKWEFEASELSPTHRKFRIMGRVDGWLVNDLVLYSNNDATWEKYQRIAKAFNDERHDPIVEAMKPEDAE